MDFVRQIHIRIQKRNGRKSITTVAGLDAEFDFKKILKRFRKLFSCNGSIQISPKDKSKVIQLQGDQRASVAEWLIKNLDYKKEEIKIHGY